tara:strand:+ start:1098 stop:1283 length:186 start_codon:yes stop_codon:yes gene_type:complete
VAYHILFLKCQYVKDDSSETLSENTFTQEYSDRKTYSTESAALDVVSSLNVHPGLLTVVQE